MKYTFLPLSSTICLKFFSISMQCWLYLFTKYLSFGFGLGIGFGIGIGIGIGIGMQWLSVSVSVAFLPIPKLPKFRYRQEYRFRSFTRIDWFFKIDSSKKSVLTCPERINAKKLKARNLDQKIDKIDKKIDKIGKNDKRIDRYQKFSSRINTNTQRNW